MTLSGYFTSKSVFNQQGCRALTFARLSCHYSLLCVCCVCLLYVFLYAYVSFSVLCTQLPELCLYHTEPTVYTVRPARSLSTVTPKSAPDTVSYGQHVRSQRSAHTVSTVTHGRPYGLYSVSTVSCYGLSSDLQSPRKV